MYGLFVDDGACKLGYPKYKLVMVSENRDTLRDIAMDLTGRRKWVATHDSVLHDEGKIHIKKVISV